MSPIWAAALLAAIGGLLFLLTYSKPTTTNPPPPPGPAGLPVLGSLHTLGPLPHRTLHRLSKKHGPIMRINLGMTSAVIASSPDAARMFLKDHDHAFAGRPASDAATYLGYGGRDVVFCSYGPYWRSLRKLVTARLLNPHMIESLAPMRRGEVARLIGRLRDDAQLGSVVDVRARLTSLSADATCLMLFGRRYEEETGMVEVVPQSMELVGTFNLAEFIPFIGWMDLQGIRRRMRAVHRVYDGILERIIEEHRREGYQGQARDFIDVLLAYMDSGNTEFPIDDTIVKAILTDMIAGALDTSPTAIEWALAELIRHPEVMKKAQEELRTVVGEDRMVEESDLPKLTLLEMVIKETFRVHPVAPLLAAHESTEDRNVGGYHIPKGTRLVVNAFAIARDPDTWRDPDEWIPERFTGEGDVVDVKGKDFRMLPFGSGRRGCPGMDVGLTMIRLVLAQLIHCFDWGLPEGTSPSDMDMKEKFGLEVPKAEHLMAVPIQRLDEGAYKICA